MAHELGSRIDRWGVVPLKRLIRVTAVAAILALPLASCDILFMGSFPSDTAQATARVDLSSSISASAAGSFTLSIARSGKYEYILLVSTLGFDTSLPHLLVLSPALQVQNSHSLDDIIACNPSGIPWNGTAVMTHLADGRVVIGNLQTAASSAGLSLDMKLTAAPAELNGWTVEGPQPSFLTWSDFNLDPSTHQLSYVEYAGDWSTRTTRNTLVSSPAGIQYSLEGVFTDPEDSLNNLALVVFSESNTGQSAFHFIMAPKNPDFANQFPGPEPIMENPAYTSTQFVKNDLEQGTICVTSDSIIGYDSNTQSLVRFTPADPSAEARLHVPGLSSGMQIAFSFSGTYYCRWDPATRVLTRYERWW